MKGKGEMTTYWLTGTKSDIGEGDPDNSRLRPEAGMGMSILDGNLLNPKRSRKLAVARTKQEQVINISVEYTNEDDRGDQIRLCGSLLTSAIVIFIMIS